MDQIKKLAELLDKYNLSITNVMKRVDGEFKCRLVWELEALNDEDDAPEGFDDTEECIIKKYRRCRWEGFDDTEECIADLLKQT